MMSLLKPDAKVGLPVSAVTHSSGWELLSSYRLRVQRNELISPLGCHENFPKEIGKAHKYSRTYNEPNRDVTE